MNSTPKWDPSGLDRPFFDQKTFQPRGSLGVHDPPVSVIGPLSLTRLHEASSCVASRPWEMEPTAKTCGRLILTHAHKGWGEGSGGGGGAQISREEAYVGSPGLFDGPRDEAV